MLGDGPEVDAWLGLMERHSTVDRLVTFFYDSLSSMMSQAEEFFSLQQGMYDSYEVRIGKAIAKIADNMMDRLNSLRCCHRRCSSFLEGSRILSRSGRESPRWHPLAPLVEARDPCPPYYPTLRRTLRQ